MLRAPITLAVLFTKELGLTLTLDRHIVTENVHAADPTQLLSNTTCDSLSRIVINYRRRTGESTTSRPDTPDIRHAANSGHVSRKFVVFSLIDVLLSPAGHLHWDLRLYYDTVHWDKAIQGRDALRRVAISPDISRLCIIHPLLPWTITVRRHRREGIRVIDILRAIYACLNTHLRTRDLWNQKITTEHHLRIQNAAILRDGVVSRQRCVDFLEDKYMFSGLEVIEDNLFRMKTASMCGKSV
ncbi:hypothetical protein BDZ89DRAFT_1226417 [Hymenopellis radicata]|nr:hypothetical protein BDZ89DRAFT_1226417 [Hymenopellis radicata]